MKAVYPRLILVVVRPTLKSHSMGEKNIFMDIIDRQIQNLKTQPLVCVYFPKIKTSRNFTKVPGENYKCLGPPRRKQPTSVLWRKNPPSLAHIRTQHISRPTSREFKAIQGNTWNFGNHRISSMWRKEPTNAHTMNHPKRSFPGILPSDFCTYHEPPKPTFLEVFMVNNLVFRWPKPLFFMVLGAHGSFSMFLALAKTSQDLTLVFLCLICGPPAWCVSRSCPKPCRTHVVSSPQHAKEPQGGRVSRLRWVFKHHT